MNNERYNQIIDEAYDNWCKQFEIDSNNFNVDELVKGHGDQCWGYPLLENTSKEYKRGQINAYLEGKADKPFFYLTKEQFINKCKTNPEFSEKWGLKIEERELSLEERMKILINKGTIWNIIEFSTRNHEYLNEENIPTKLITITYNNETIEVYE